MDSSVIPFPAIKKFALWRKLANSNKILHNTIIAQINRKNSIHYLLQLRGFHLRGIPFTLSFGFVPFLHLRINKSSIYTIFGKDLK